MCEYSFNPYLKTKPCWRGAEYSFLDHYDMLDFHRSINGYRPTPLVALPELAQSFGLGEIYVKDESQRFGIKAFKALGASYAIYRLLKTQWESRFDTTFNAESFKNPAVLKKLGSFTFSAATDGNHGRAVAWTAKKLRQRAVIFMPEGSARARIENIAREGAKVVIVAGTFDDCVKRCARESEENGWQVIADTAYAGYNQIPQYIMLGYTTLFREMENSIHKKDAPAIDFVILPAGVGGIAAAGTSYYVKKYADKRPNLICVEPLESDCFLESIRFGSGKPIPTKGKQKSLMVGLDCGIPSLVAWPIIRDGVHLFIAISDQYAEQAMRLYARENIVSGESGASGLAGLLALCSDKNLQKAREQIGLENSRVLLINTEGDTDPANYKRIVGN